MDQCVFIRGFRAKRALFGIRVIGIGSGRDVPQRSRPMRVRRQPSAARNNGLRNASESSFLGNDDHGGSSSSLDTIGPPERSPYWRDGLHNSASNDSHVWGSSSSLNTIRPINHENPQLLPYPSSTKVDRVHNRLHHVTQALHCVIADQIVYNSSTSLKIKI